MINPSHLKLTLSSILFQQCGSSCLCIMRVAVTHWRSQSHSRFGILKEHLAPLCLTPMSARGGVMKEPNLVQQVDGFVRVPASVTSPTSLQLAHFRHHCHNPHSCVVLCCLTVTPDQLLSSTLPTMCSGHPVSSPHPIGLKSKRHETVLSSGCHNSIPCL